MKKIITKPENTINLENVNPLTSHFGVKTTQGKGYLAHNGERWGIVHGGNYQSRALEGYGDKRNAVFAVDFIRILINSLNYEVYQFDTPKELFNWVFE